MSPASLLLPLRLLCRSAAGHEVQNDGDDGEDQQQMNQKTADVQESEPAEPAKNQNYCKDEKHSSNLLSVRIVYPAIIDR